MCLWLQEKGELRQSQEDDGHHESEVSGILSTDVGEVVRRILSPYMMGSKGSSVLGLLLR